MFCLPFWLRINVPCVDVSPPVILRFRPRNLHRFMKFSACLRLFLLGSSLLATPCAHADYLFWDGGTVNIGTNGNGVSGGTAGDWDNTLGENTLNWDQGVGLAHVAWTNANLDTAVFGGTAGTVTLTDPISVGGLTFFSNSGYTIAAGTEGLTFGAATNQVRMLNVSGTTSAATISGTVTGTGNLVFTSVAPDVASTLTFNGTSAGGWSGTTTINPGMTLSLAASNQALLNTSGITLNGGNILLTNTATGSENTINRVSNTAAIASYGNGSIAIANTATASRAYTETIGSITHHNGQLSLGFTTVQNQTSNTQTLIVGGLTNNGTTSTIAINGGGSGAGAIHGNSEIRVNGITTSTAANEIIGPWMTAGTILAAQSDWAIYQSDGISGRVVSRGIAGSAQTTWTSSSATGNYTAANANPLTSTVNNRLTANRFVNTLRATFTEINASSGTNWNINIATDTITFGSHALTDGDVVAFRTAPSGLTDNRPYYVINAAPGTFQLSLTPGGGVLDLTTVQAATSFMATGLNLDGNTLGMNGYITGTTGTAAIGGGSASTITLPTTTSGNLYLHGATGIWIDPSIKDNGAGVLTLVKSGTNTVTLSGANTYTGGTVINAGTLAIGSVSNLGGAGASLTFAGTGTLAPSAALNFSTGTLTVDDGAFGTITGNGATAFATTTGTGTLRYTSDANTKSLNLGNASGFTGNLEFRLTNNANYDTQTTLQFSSLGDGVGSVLQVGGGQSDSTAPGQRVNIVLTGGSAPLVFDNRVIEILPRIASNHTVQTTRLHNNNSDAANTWIINTDLSYQVADTGRSFELAGSNTGNNAFNGVISNGDLGGTLNLRKDGAGKWIVSGNNTYTGSTTVLAGVLEATNLADGGSDSAIGKSTNAAANLVFGAPTATLRYTGASNVNIDRGFTMSSGTGGGATIESSGAGTLSFDNTVAIAYGTASQTRLLTLGGTNTGLNTFGKTIANNTSATSLVKSGVGTWVLSVANSYTGTTSINDGALEAVDGTGLTTTSILQLRGGVFQSSGTFTRAVGTASGNVNWSSSSGGFAARGGTLNLQLNGGTGSLTWNGSSMVSTGQSLIFGSSSADSLVDFQNGLNLGSSGSGQRTITVKDNAATTTDIARISGVISNTVAGWGIVKNGAGTLQLTNNNTYTGPTSVDAGTLAVGGTGDINQTSAINVAAGATFAYNSSTALTVSPTLNGTGTGSGQRAVLGGTGPINTAVTLDNLGDTLSPGNSPGIQNFTPAQTWSSFSYDWEVNNFTGTTAGTDFDQISLGSTLNLSGATGAYILNVLGLTGGDLAGLVPNFSEIDRSWTILTSTGITGFNAANWTINTTGFTNLDTGTWSLAQSGNDLILSYAAVPEPHVALLGCFGVLALLRRRR